MARQRHIGRVLCVLLAVLLSVPVYATDAPAVNAAGAVVMDADTGEVYYAKNADEARPVASMTKLMAVYLALGEIRAGRLALDTPVIIGANAAAMSNNELYSGLEHFRAGQAVPVDTLLRLIMTASGNASVLALAEQIDGDEAAFVKRMNARAAAWGINARFADCCGFEDDGNAVTPYAMAYLARRIVVDYPEVLTYSALQGVDFQGRTYQTTNLLLRDSRFDGIDGLKTGYTRGAGYCFTATATRNGRRIIAVVMGTDSYAARMDEAQKLLEYGFAGQAERDAPYTFTGRLSVRRAEIYPDASVTVACRVTCEQAGADLLLPCGWYLDGEPITGFQNSSCRLTGGKFRQSQITLQGERLAAGEHVLEFRVNPAGLQGAEQYAMRTELLVLSDADAA